MTSSSPSIKPPIFYGWTMVGVVFFVLMLSSGVTHNLYGVLAVPLERAFDISRAQVMAATASMAMVGSGIVSPLLGIALQRQSIRNWMIFGCLSLIAGFCLLSQASALWQVGLIYLCFWALGTTAFGHLSGNTLVNNWFIRRRGLALGVTAMGTSVGAFMFPPLVTWLIDVMGWRQACLVIGAILLTALPVMRWLIVDRPEQKNLHPDGSNRAFEQAEPPASNVTAVLKSGNFWVIVVCVGICFGCFNGIMANLVPMAIDQGFSAQKASFLMSFSAVLSLLGKMAIGAATDRLTPRMSLAMPLVTLALACIVLTGEPGYRQMAVGSCLIGLAAGGTAPVWGTLIGRYFGRASFSTVMGLMNPMLVPFMIAGSVSAAYINDKYGSYDYAFYAFIGLVCVALLVSGRLQEHT